jgi:tRNA A-37 threonylcarbamoyl transferase component Bud32
VLKRFNFRKVANLVKDFFRSSRARRAFRLGYHLELADIPIPRSIATADQRFGGILLRSYLIMEEIRGAIDLYAHIRAVPCPDRSLVRQAAELVAKLHEEGFSHRDLKLSNLVKDDNDRLFVLDLDGVRFMGAIPDSRAASDLRRLAQAVADCPGVTSAHRALFARTYCKARRLRKVPR